MEEVWVGNVGCLDLVVGWCKTVLSSEFGYRGETSFEQKMLQPSAFNSSSASTVYTWQVPASVSMWVLFKWASVSSALIMRLWCPPIPLSYTHIPSSTIIYFRLGSINQLPLEIPRSSFKNSWSVLAPNPLTRLTYLWNHAGHIFLFYAQ